MMNGLKKSDEAVRPVRAANKGARASAESPEERASTKGNPDCQSTRRTQCRVSVPQAAARIRKAAERNPKERLTALFHHITPDALGAAYFALKKDAAAGVDGVTWDMYGEGLDERLLDLHRRLHRGGAYRAPPVRRVEIPKPDGGTRPLGIAALEDKVVQKAVVDVILTPIYEVVFLGFSYGFRPGRGAHDALDALAFGIERRKVSWIVDADLRAYFDTIPRDWLITFLEHRIGDRRVIRLIRKWLNAGVIESGSWADTGMGTPQGAIVSPVLANVFLHYVLDVWFHKKWRPNVPDGRRFADILAQAHTLIAEEHFLNWQVVFPGVWSDWQSAKLTGGFDAVIGNPPWDRMKLQQVEWFAARKRDIAMALRASDRKRMIAELEEVGDLLADDFAKANARAEASARMARAGGDYPLLSGGDVNLYSLFVERAMTIVKPEGR